MPWEPLNLSVHTSINGHTTPSCPRPSANTGTGINGHASPPPILSDFYPGIYRHAVTDDVSRVVWYGRRSSTSNVYFDTTNIIASNRKGCNYIDKPTSMFESANLMRNAFYEPSPIQSSKLYQQRGVSFQQTLIRNLAICVPLVEIGNSLVLLV
jgi:hypothetical protein